MKRVCDPGPLTDADLREPIFVAIDQLREAFDRALELDNERVANLLLIALQDLADTVDLTDAVATVEPLVQWRVACCADRL